MANTLYKDAFEEYIDVDFSFKRHPITDNVSIKRNISSVKQSVINLMQLRAGDKPFHPEIESPLYVYLFESASPILEVIVQDEVRNYLATYEPRVEISDIKIKFPQANAMTCTITGNIIDIQEKFTVNVLVDVLR